ncbi:187-kDa microtubule-associated protein AIR9 [Diplonema papillatum]|nr:187-kDa microtubule-associated protein AIR9 [Diplonema papillatum]KAJ9443840.1 187-kDa microtubule-associated protein AIR9 [Diplonema papillatum]
MAGGGGVGGAVDDEILRTQANNEWLRQEIKSAQDEVSRLKATFGGSGNGRARGRGDAGAAPVQRYSSMDSYPTTEDTPLQGPQELRYNGPSDAGRKSSRGVALDEYSSYSDDRDYGMAARHVAAARHDRLEQGNGWVSRRTTEAVAVIEADITELRSRGTGGRVDRHASQNGFDDLARHPRSSASPSSSNTPADNQRALVPSNGNAVVPVDTPPDTESHALLEVYINRGTAVGDTAEAVSLFSDAVCDFKMDPPKLTYAWSAVAQDTGEELAIGDDSAVVTVPDGCADHFLKVVVTAAETPSSPPRTIEAMTSTPVAYSVPVVAEVQIIRAEDDGTDGDPTSPMPTEVLSFRYRLVKDVVEGRPLCKWFRGGLELVSRTNALDYEITEEDVGCEIKLQLTPVAPDGAPGTPVIVSGGKAAAMKPRLTELAAIGDLRPGNTLQPAVKGRLLHLLDDLSYQWATSTGKSVARLAVGPSFELQKEDVGKVVVLRATATCEGKPLPVLETRTRKVESKPSLADTSGPYVGVPVKLTGLHSNARVRWLSKQPGDDSRWSLLSSDQQYTPGPAELDKLLQIEVAWQTEGGDVAQEIIQTSPVGVKPPSLPTAPVIEGQPMSVGGQLKCVVTGADPKELSVVWEKLCTKRCESLALVLPKNDTAQAGCEAGEWKTIGTGLILPVIAEDVGSRIRVSAAVKREGREGARLTTHAVGTVPDRVQGCLEPQAVPYQYPILRCKKKNVMWQISSDGGISWDAVSLFVIDAEKNAFAPTADHVLHTVRVVDNSIGREELGRYTYSLPPVFVKDLECLLTAGITGFSITLNGSNGQLIISHAGYKLYLGDNKQPFHRYKWCPDVTIYCGNEPKLFVMTLPDGSSLRLHSLKAEQRDRLVTAFRLFHAMSEFSYPDYMPKSLWKAWRKGKTHGKSSLPAHRQALANFLATKQRHRFVLSSNPAINVLAAFLSPTY